MYQTHKCLMSPGLISDNRVRHIKNFLFSITLPIFTWGCECQVTWWECWISWLGVLGYMVVSAGFHGWEC